MSPGNGVDPVGAALEAAGVGEGRTVRRLPLTGGTYNTVVRVTLDDGRDWVVKIPPAPAVGLSYEQNLLKGEVTFYASAAALREPVLPEIVHSELDPAATPGPHLIMTTREGAPWHEAEGSLSAGEARRLREDLGRLIGRLHAVTGPGYGYPAGQLGPLARTWRQAFTTMTDALLADAERYAARLPCPVAEIREIFSAARDVLDDVTRPALVHFDLWQGNLLIAGAPGARTLSGVIDGERMFWGDPVADFVSTALFGNIEEDEDFLAGYAATGGPVRFDASLRRRLAFYRSYLYLIMLVEVVPRQYGPDHREWTWSHAGPQLVRALEELEPAGPDSVRNREEGGAVVENNSRFN
ncbi:aminoglycoside phosphotransferase family protein [Streptomyces sp. NPDC051322]|uniref:phosphotransferase family protein n=1 Tax=Streptomyces sp. NPDC051322 TaxID=3154645 RepID=UPI00344CBBC2